MRKNGALSTLPSLERKGSASVCSVLLRRLWRGEQHGCAQFGTGSYKYALDCLQSGGG